MNIELFWLMHFLSSLAVFTILFDCSIIGDYNFQEQKYHSAARLYISGADYQSAIKSTSRAIVRFCEEDENDLLELVSAWETCDERYTYKQVMLLLNLFSDPKKSAQENSKLCIKELGAEVIRFAVRHARLEATELHAFDRLKFKLDVLAELKVKYSGEEVKIVWWYLTQHDKQQAEEFAAKDLKHWTDDELCNIIVRRMGIRPNGIVSELKQRKYFTDIVWLHLKDGNIEPAFIASEEALHPMKLAQESFLKLINIWKDALSDLKILKRLESKRRSSLFLALLLFDEPSNVSGDPTKAQRCMVKFGQDIVKYAVLRATEPSKDIIGILKSFDKKAFKSMRHIDVLKWYIVNNNMAFVLRFTSMYIKNFTNHELVGFSSYFLGDSNYDEQQTDIQGTSCA